jgi:hypothetical protein
MNPLISIAGGGGFGGLLAALLTRVTGVGIFAHWSPAADIVSEVLFGVAAALFGVYLFQDASNPQTGRTLAFAVACGLAWQPIVAGTYSYVQQYASSKTAGSAQQAANSLTGGGPPPTSSSVQAAASATADAVGKLSTITDSTDRSNILKASQSVITNVAASQNTQPSVKIDALRNIGLASLSSDSQSVGLETIQPLKQLANSDDEATRVQAQSALKDLATEAQKQNRSLVTAAIQKPG